MRPDFEIGQAQDLLENFPEPLVFYDEKGRVEYLNPPFTEVFGWTLAELKGSTIDFIPESEMDITRKALERMLSGEKVSILTRRYDKVRRILDIHVSASAFINKQGAPTGSVVIYRDITRQKIIERELTSSRNLIGGLLDVLPFGVLAVEENGLIFLANQSIHRILGYEESVIYGKTLKELNIPDLEDHEEKNVDWTSRTGENLVLALGKRSISEGRVVYSVMDMTKRVRLERIVCQGKKEIEAVFDSITDPIFMINRKKVVIRLNRAFAGLLQTDYNGVLGRPFLKLFQNMMADYDGLGLDSPRIEDMASTAEWRNLAGRMFRTHVFPVFEGKVAIGAVIRLQDITGDKEREVKLLQTEKMASIGQLAAGVAHEINNPIGYIISNLNRLGENSDELAKAKIEIMKIGPGLAEPDMKTCEQCLEILKNHDIGPVIDEIAELVDECKTGSKRVLDIVNDLKTFSHPDSGDMVPTDINACLESTVHLVWNELKYKCEVIKEYGEIPRILCRGSQMSQVFMNLLVNAAQAIPEFGTVTIRTSYDPDAKVVSVTIADTGVGIRKELQTKIFDPFFTTKEVGKGTGLGLHIALDIVKNHNGELKLKSTLGKGSEFTVELPAMNGS